MREGRRIRAGPTRLGLRCRYRDGSPGNTQGCRGFNLKAVKLSIAWSSFVVPGDGPVIPLPALFLLILAGVNHGQEEPVITVAFAVAAQLHRATQGLGRLVPVLDTIIGHSQGVPVNPLIARELDGSSCIGEGLTRFPKMNAFTCSKQPGEIVKCQD